MASGGNTFGCENISRMQPFDAKAIIKEIGSGTREREGPEPRRCRGPFRRGLGRAHRSAAARRLADRIPHRGQVDGGLAGTARRDRGALGASRSPFRAAGGAADYNGARSLPISYRCSRCGWPRSGLRVLIPGVLGRSGPRHDARRAGTVGYRGCGLGGRRRSAPRPRANRLPADRGAERAACAHARAALEAQDCAARDTPRRRCSTRSPGRRCAWVSTSRIPIICAACASTSSRSTTATCCCCAAPRARRSRIRAGGSRWSGCTTARQKR